MMKDNHKSDLSPISPMRVGGIGILICLLGCLGCFTPGRGSGERGGLPELVRGLSGEVYPEGFEAMYRRPREATALLIRNLNAVRRAKYRPAPTVVWQLRALHSLTGVRFSGSTSEVLDDQEKHWIDAPEAGQVHFYGTWMSRDMTWVAPPDAQKNIISKWRRWWRQSGTNHDYPCDRSIDSWYFH